MATMKRKRIALTEEERHAIAAARLRQRKVDRSAKAKRRREGTRTPEEQARDEQFRKPGTRGFAEGNPGRPPGISNAIPKGFRPSVKSIIERVVNTHGLTIQDAIVDGLRAGPQHSDRFLRFVTEYTDGKPSDTIHHRFDEAEIDAAKRTLGKKLNDMLETMIPLPALPEDGGGEGSGS